jgi:hypothetical protein
MTFNSELRKRDDLNEYQKQARSLLFHKTHIVKAGMLAGDISLRRLLMHDTSKLSSVEFGNYSRFKYGIKSVEDWSKAWLHHLHNNPHHPEHWILPWRGDPGFYLGYGHDLAPFVTVLPMPETYTREFVIDMMATSMEITGSYDIAVWLNANGPEINLHPETELRLDGVLIKLGYFLTDNCPWSYMAGDITRNRFAMEGATK